MRGGARQGAGRKAPNGARVSICVRISRKAKELLDKNKGDESLGTIIDKAIINYYE